MLKSNIKYRPNPEIAISKLLRGLQAPTLEEAKILWSTTTTLGQPSENEDWNAHEEEDWKAGSDKNESTEHKYVHVDGDGNGNTNEEIGRHIGEDISWEHLRNFTISRDQTAASGFEEQRLTVLGERSIRAQVNFGGLLPQPLNLGPDIGEDSHGEQYRIAGLIFDRSWDRQSLLCRLDDYPISDESDLDNNTISKPSYLVSSLPEPDMGPVSDSFDTKRHAATLTHGETSRLATEPSSFGAMPTLDLDDEANDFGHEGLLKELMQKIARLEAENQVLRKSAPESEKELGPAEPKAPIHQTLYRLDPNTVCLSEPSWILSNGKPTKLKAESQIQNLHIYLERHPEIAFVIYKDYQWIPDQDALKESAPGDDLIKPPEPVSEAIKLTTDQMTEALGAYLDLLPEFSKQFPDFDPKIKLSAPYRFWYYARVFYADFAPRLKAHHRQLMDLLSGWIEGNYGEEYRLADHKLEHGSVTRPLLDYLVRPGDVLVQRKDDQLLAYMASSWTIWMTPWRTSTKKTLAEINAQDSFTSELTLTDGESEGKVRYYTECIVSCWSWAYDGSFYEEPTEIKLSFHTAEPDGDVNIQSLSAYPLRYASDQVKDLLKRRGEIRWACRNSKLVEYFEGGLKDEQSEGERHMIDHVTYTRVHAEGKRVSLKKHDSDHRRQLQNNKGPVGNEIYLFESRVTGFNFRRKKWVDLNADYIRDVKWNKKAFNNLVLGTKTKELIEALVTTQIDSEKSTDMIRGKGNGLIMLLHGGPGTGKTFTAETVAEIAEKPLYRVTCGDIGTEAQQVEEYLEAVLYLGKIWGCVVLLDEADVFLEERGLSDLQRNALVSVFLRVLEYYDGILILTSNRVGTFDEAFKSRIQLALHYKNLTIAQRKKIWRNFLNWLAEIGEAGSIDLDDISDNLEDLAKYEMNGRQIRNSITTARQLAGFRGKVMSYDDLEHVISVAGEFEDYLKDVKEGMSGDQTARLDGLR